MLLLFFHSSQRLFRETSETLLSLREHKSTASNHYLQLYSNSSSSKLEQSVVIVRVVALKSTASNHYFQLYSNSSSSKLEQIVVIVRVVVVELIVKESKHLPQPYAKHYFNYFIHLFNP